MDRRRHQLRRFGAGIAEHDALVAGALVLVAGGVDALGDVHRLRMEQDVDLRRLPVESLLLVADVLDRGAGKVDRWSVVTLSGPRTSPPITTRLVVARVSQATRDSGIAPR